ASTPQESEQEDLTSDLALTRASIQLRRQAIVTSVMDLSPKEAEAFWPLYREYRVEMAKVGDRVSKLLVDYSGQYDTRTDEQARKIMKEWLSIEQAKMSVKGKYVSKFQKILPARKVMRFFQADNKLDAVINAQLASVVPLARWRRAPPLEATRSYIRSYIKESGHEVLDHRDRRPTRRGCARERGAGRGLRLPQVGAEPGSVRE